MNRQRLYTAAIAGLTLILLLCAVFFFAPTIAYTLIFIGTILGLFYLVLISQKKMVRADFRRRQAAQQLALRMHPAYRQMEEHDRQHQIERERLAHELRLAQERQAHELALQWQEFQLRLHLAMTRLEVSQYGTYLLNQEDAHLTQLTPIYKPAQLKAPETTITPSGLLVPAPYDMQEIWRTGFRPSTKQIWLCKSAENDIIVPGNKLLHSVATGPTGGGKTNIVRMELAQLVYIGCVATLMDIHYAPIKTDEDGNEIDWRPIVKHLAQEPIYDLGLIIKWMQWLAYTELQARIDRQRNGQPIGRPIYFTIAELPAVLDEAEDAVADPLAKILRQGRQYLIFFVGDSQDLLTETLHMTTGPRECFRTGFYTGGDSTTAKALLDLPKGVTVSEDGLGIQGLVYVKTAIHPYTQGRVGWMSNEALYDLFETPIHERLEAPGRSYHQTFDRRSETPLYERVERIFSERPDAEIVDAESSEMEPDTEQPSNVRTFLQPDRAAHEEPTHSTSGERLQYTLSDSEIDQFKAAYRASGNIDKALAAIGKGSNYRECARRIIQVYALRKEEA